MKPLFITQVCDFCDGVDADESDWDVGYVVLRRPLPADEYVFPTREDAEMWIRAQKAPTGPIREVRAPYKFHWRKSTGTVKDLMTADRLVTIFPDRRFPPAPYRAYVTPEGA